MYSKQRNRTRLSEIEILKELAVGCISTKTQDINNDCWLRQLVLIESFVREVPEYIASMVHSLRITNVSDQKCLKSFRIQILNHFKAKVSELKDKIDATMTQVDAISDDIKEQEHNIDGEHEEDVLSSSTEGMHKNTGENQMTRDGGKQIPNCDQAMQEEYINDLSTNNGSSSDDNRADCKSDKAAQFTCPDCSDTLTSLRALHLHRRQVHCELKPHKCDRCPMAFKHPSTLRRHQRTPHNRDVRQQQYLCDLCPLVCANKNKFKVHRRTHTGENSFVCDICSRSLGTKNCLVTHMRTHTNERPFQCLECLKTFRQRSGFRIHRLTHTDHRPHKCIWCVKSFLTKNQLSRHLLSHTGERPHSCPICKRGYKKRYICKKHIQRAHRDVDVDVVFPNLPKRSNKITSD